MLTSSDQNSIPNLTRHLRSFNCLKTIHIIPAVFTVQSGVVLSSQSPVKYPQVLMRQKLQYSVLREQFFLQFISTFYITNVSFELSHMPLKMPLGFFRLSLTETTLLIDVQVSA